MVKKSLGQHFLNAPGVVDDIIEASEIKAGDRVIEIGPGKGVLTKELLKTDGTIIAIEKDDWLSKDLRETFAEEIAQGKLILRNADFLKDPMPEMDEGEYKVVANIPYNITGLILRRLFEHTNLPERVVFMVQKEVADRIIARDSKESLVGMCIKVYGEPQYIRTVKPGSFIPAPKVDSAVISILNISRDAFKTPEAEELYFKLVKAGFSERRKQVKNNLKTLVESEKMAQLLDICKLPHDIRAEDMKKSDWLCLIKNLLG